jgi:hypothetical protein
MRKSNLGVNMKGIKYCSLLILLFLPIAISPREYANSNKDKNFTPEQEIIERRTLNSKHYDNEDGTYTCRIWTGPVHYKGENGKYLNIKRNILPNSKLKGYDYACETNGLKSYFPKQYSASNGIRVEANENTWLQWHPIEMFISNIDGSKETVKKINGSINKDTITYKQTFQNVIDEYIIRPNGLKHNIILEQLPEELAGTTNKGFLNFVFEIEYSPNLIPYNSDTLIMVNTVTPGPIILKHKQENFSLRFSKISVYEQGNKKVRTIGEYEFDSNTLQIKVPCKWLQSPERLYPVVIDPTVQIFPDALCGYYYWLFGWIGPNQSTGVLAAGLSIDYCGFSPFGTGGVLAGSSISSMVWRLVNNNSGGALTISVTKIHSDYPDGDDCWDEPYINGLSVATGSNEENFFDLSGTAAVTEFENAVNGSGSWYGLGIKGYTGSGNQRFFYGTWDFNGIDSRLDITYELQGVELTNFTATPGYEEINIRWRVESEEDNIEWRILKAESKNGDYEKIATIPGRGTEPTPKEYSYVDRNVTLGKTYYYKLADVDSWGKVVYHGPIVATVLKTTKSFKLLKYTPAPFTDKVTISYSIFNTIDVSLQIYSNSGSLVKSFIKREHSPGEYSVSWYGKDNSGKKVNSGVYFVRLTTSDNKTETKKVVYLK